MNKLITRTIELVATPVNIWAIVIGIVAYFWFSDPLLRLGVALTILFNIIAAALAGVVLPVILDKLKIEPPF